MKKRKKTFFKGGRKMEKKKIPWLTTFLLAGSLLAYLIGSGFSSGQETIQFFSGYVVSE